MKGYVAEQKVSEWQMNAWTFSLQLSDGLTLSRVKRYCVVFSDGWANLNFCIFVL